MKYELIVVVNGEVQILPKPLQKLREMQQIKVLAEIREKELKAELLEAMQEHGIKSIQAEGFSAVLVDETVRVGIDTTRLKKEKPEIAEEYERVSKVKANVRVSFDD